MNKLRKYISLKIRASKLFVFVQKLLIKSGRWTLVISPMSVTHPRQISIGSESFIGPNSRLDAFSGEIEIGSRVYATSSVNLFCDYKITIEDDVLIASYVLITDMNHSTDISEGVNYQTDNSIGGPVVIRRGAWIGEKATILPGVSVGERAIVAANSVVTSDVAEYTMVAGMPAKPIAEFNFSQRMWIKCR